MDDQTNLLRHLLATLAYRTDSALADAPQHFGAFDAGMGVRTPQAILHHMSSLLSHTIAAFAAKAPAPLPPGADLRHERTRLRDLLRQLSGVLQRTPPATPELAQRLLQGPLTDAIAHAGQLALLRRLAGLPIAPEDFFSASIEVANLDIVEEGTDT